MDTKTADIMRRYEATLTFGKIAKVDFARGRLQVDVGDPYGGPDACRRTGWIPIPGKIGNNYIANNPMRVGTSVLLACPSGDPANARVVSVFYTNDFPDPAPNGDMDTIVFNDGTKITYNSAAHALTADVKGSMTAQTTGAALISAGTTLTATSDGKATINAGGDLSAKSGGVATIAAATAVNLSAPVIGLGPYASGSGGTLTITSPVIFKDHAEFEKTIHAAGDITTDGANSNHHAHAAPEAV